MRYLLVGWIYFWGVGATFAQTDAHYWTNQYGAKGLLLNGAVIASTEDETAIFYNPGAMGTGEEFGLSLSFLTPTFAVLETRNFLGNGTKVRDRDFGFTSGFAAVGFRLFNNERFRGGATTFTRFKSNLNFRGREIGRVPDSDLQIFIGNLDFQRRLSERWMGFGMSYQMGANISLGVSQFVVFHSESTNIEIAKEIVNRDRPEQLIFGWRSKLRYSFTASGGMLTKFGLSWQPPKFKFGLTLTTPTYNHIIRSAAFEFDDLRKPSPDTTFIKSNLSGVSLKDYKTPWSLGFGLDFAINPKTRISFSTEYFHEIETYTIMEDTDDPFDGFSLGDFSEEVSIKTGNKQVCNVALGIQRELENESTLILGFRTDFNQRKEVEGFSDFAFLAATPSIYHFSAGGLFNVWKNQMSLGIDYGVGRRTGGQQLVDFSNISPDDLFSLTPTENAKSIYHSIVLVMTYDFIFKRKKKKK
ncbi:MAG: hypothetical protein AAF960_23210 [Bacteroidota bacterium]